MNGWLPEQTVALVGAGVEALKTTFGARLEAALLVGAAMNPARADRGREPEVVALVSGEVTREDLEALARAAKRPMGRGLRLRVLSRWDFERSTDVFALEIAEWRDRHHLLAGRDPFAEVVVSPTDLRTSVERALRGFQRRLRNRMLAALATDGRRDDAQRAAADLLERLVVLAHHVLQLLELPVPRDEAELLTALAECVDQRPPETALARLVSLRAGRPIEDALGLLDSVAPLVRAVTERVDRLGDEEHRGASRVASPR